MLSDLATSVWSMFDSDDEPDSFGAVVTNLVSDQLQPVTDTQEDLQQVQRLQVTCASWGWTPQPDGELRKQKFWKHLGFQRDDPMSDFRACGRLAVTQLLCYTQLYPLTASQAAERQYRARTIDVSRSYPWAAASVNATMLCCSLLGLRQAALWARQQRVSFPERPGQLSRRRAQCCCIQSLDDVHALHALSMQMIDQSFQRLAENGGGYLQFSEVLRSTHDALLRLLLGRPSNVKELFDRARHVGWRVVGPVTSISARCFTRDL